MVSPWLHRCAVLLSLGSLAILATGVFITGSDVLLFHRAISIAVGALSVGMAGWLSVAGAGPRLRQLGWSAAAVVIVEALLGIQGVRKLSPAGVSVFHACLAQLFFAGTVAIALLTSRGWGAEPELVKDSGWPSLRSLAILTPSLVMVQIVLGAGFRYKALSVLPHVGIAMVVALLNLMMGVFVIQQFPKHPSLRPAAVVMMVMTFSQIILGVAVISLASLFPENASPVLYVTAVHVSVGALTLASTVVLAILIRRHVRATLPE